jgi:ABC-2 type transport system ATP-binding protein
MLEAVNLRKSFGTLVAVDDVSLRIEKGETVGLLGPNGAGKTTTVSMLCGLATPDRGQVNIDGRPLGGDTNPGKRKIGLVPQDLALYEELTRSDNLNFSARCTASPAPSSTRPSRPRWSLSDWLTAPGIA